MLGARVMQWPRQVPSGAKRIVQLGASEVMMLRMGVKATRHQHHSVRKQSCCMQVPSMGQVVSSIPEAICDIVKHSEMRNFKAEISSRDEYLTILQQSRYRKGDRLRQGAGEAPGSSIGIIEFCLVVANPACCADHQHLAIRQKSRRVEFSHGTHITGLAPSPGGRIVKFCAPQDGVGKVRIETSGYQNPPVTKQGRCMNGTSLLQASGERPFARIWIVQFS